MKIYDILLKSKRQLEVSSMEEQQIKQLLRELSKKEIEEIIHNLENIQSKHKEELST